jgi:hypothetical protein
MKTENRFPALRLIYFPEPGEPQPMTTEFLNFEIIPEGKYSIEISYLGYQKYQAEIELTGNRKQEYPFKTAPANSSGGSNYRQLR